MGEIRSLLPADVKVLAMTATATKTLRTKVAEVIGLKDPLVIAVSPCRPNIILYAMANFTSLVDTFAPLLLDLIKQRTLFPCSIIYCRTHEHCSKLYQFFKSGLKGGFTEPPNSTTVSELRLVEMFTSCVDEEVKSQIITLPSPLTSTP